MPKPPEWEVRLLGNVASRKDYAAWGVVPSSNHGRLSYAGVCARSADLRGRQEWSPGRLCESNEV